jgi:hypothetical protein
MMEELWRIAAIVVGTVSIYFALLKSGKKQAIRDSALLPLGITVVVLGIVFGDDRLVGYSFIGVEALLSITSNQRV